VLELEDVSYRYAGSARPVLRAVTLTVGEGEILGVAGANDAGKSTLCLVASGLAPASIGGELGGSVLIGGRPTAGLAPHLLAGLAGIVFQSPTSHLSGISGSVFEEVALGPVNLGLPVPDSVTRARRAMDALGIADLAEREPSRLSGGQAQLVAIASILAMRSRCLVLDEPAAELDPDGTDLLVGALRAAASLGMAVLLAVLDEGAVALAGPTGGVLGDDRLDELGVRR
jgi:energy-coupling factor transporter ATP-binding protein EcfA2